MLGRNTERSGGWRLSPPCSYLPAPPSPPQLIRGKENSGASKPGAFLLTLPASCSAVRFQRREETLRVGAGVMCRDKEHLKRGWRG